MRLVGEVVGFDAARGAPARDAGRWRWSPARTGPRWRSRWPASRADPPEIRHSSFHVRDSAVNDPLSFGQGSRGRHEEEPGAEQHDRRRRAARRRVDQDRLARAQPRAERAAGDARQGARDRAVDGLCAEHLGAAARGAALVHRRARLPRRRRQPLHPGHPARRARRVPRARLQPAAASLPGQHRRRRARDRAARAAVAAGRLHPVAAARRFAQAARPDGAPGRAVRARVAALPRRAVAVGLGRRPRRSL